MTDTRAKKKKLWGLGIGAGVLGKELWENKMDQGEEDEPKR